MWVTSQSLCTKLSTFVDNRVVTVNNSIHNKTDGSDIDYTDNNNIEARHLNRSNLHLNQYGTPKLAGNMINYTKKVSI